MMSTETNEHRFSKRAFSGLSLEHTPAPILRRLLAYAIDLGIFYFTFIVSYIVVVLVTVALLPLYTTKTLVTLPLILLAILIPSFLIGILFFYHAYFFLQEYRKGHTPGKHIMGLYIIGTDTARPGLWQCVLRDFMRYIDALLIIPGFISMNCSRRNQRLGDYMAGTLVCYAPYREDEQYALFLKWEDLQYLRGIIDYTPFTIAESRNILGHAMHCYFYRQVAPTDNELDKFSRLLSSNIAVDERYFIPREMLFLYAAEEARYVLREGQA